MVSPVRLQAKTSTQTSRSPNAAELVQSFFRRNVYFGYSPTIRLPFPNAGLLYAVVMKTDVESADPDGYRIQLRPESAHAFVDSHSEPQSQSAIKIELEISQFELTWVTVIRMLSLL
jgi:hypothetical protein